MSKKKKCAEPKSEYFPSFQWYVCWNKSFFRSITFLQIFKENLNPTSLSKNNLINRQPFLKTSKQSTTSCFVAVNLWKLLLPPQTFVSAAVTLSSSLPLITMVELHKHDATLWKPLNCGYRIKFEFHINLPLKTLLVRFVCLWIAKEIEKEYNNIIGCLSLSCLLLF